MTTLVCTKIEKVDYLFNYIGVNVCVTYDGIVVSFPSGYGVTQTDGKATEDETVVFNSFNSVVAQYDGTKKVLRLLKDPMPFSELRDEIRQSIRQAVQRKQLTSQPLTKEMFESSAFPVDKFMGAFVSK